MERKFGLQETLRPLEIMRNQEIENQLFFILLFFSFYFSPLLCTLYFIVFFSFNSMP